MIDAKTISDLVDELDLASDDVTSYFNPATGEIFTAMDDELGFDESETDEFEDETEDADEQSEMERPDQKTDWLEDAHAKMREIEQSGNWLMLPNKFEVHEWAIMRDFAISMKDANFELSDRLIEAIHGTGAFRCFRNELHRAGMETDWFAFKRAALTNIILDWLRQHDIATAIDSEEDL